MDNQRTLFKKFFNNSSGSNSSNNTTSSGFNPPKFQFNKKKLGLGLINKHEEAFEDKKMIKEIESVEIESEMVPTEHMEIDSISDTEMDSVVTTVADTLVTNATWSTLNDNSTMNTSNTTNNTMNTFNTMNITNNNTNKVNNMNTVTIVNNNRQDLRNKSASLMYSNTLEKNRDKYNLSNQLETFSMQLELFEREIEEKRVKMDLLILSFEEKLGKIDARVSFIYSLVQCNNFHLDMDILL